MSTRQWQVTPLPLWSGGENSSAAPLADERAGRLENVLLTGTGVAAQQADWRLASTLTNGTTQNQAACGIFPFAQQGGASAVSAGVAISYKASDDTLWLHQLGETGDVLRTLQGAATYLPTIPPQITGFEMFGKFYWNAYGREAAGDRIGLSVFDPSARGVASSSAAMPTTITTSSPHGLFTGDHVLISGHDVAAVNGRHTITVTGASTFTIPVTSTGGSGGTYCVVSHPAYDLVGGGSTAGRLRFRGIAKHRGGLILGWGYQNEETGSTDQPHIVRYCKYGAPDTWIPDTTETSAGFFALGTLNVPVVAAAASGQYTILGKEAEVFALDGEYGGQLYVRQIGQAHGPISTTGMVSTGPLAVWLSSQGVAISQQGGRVQLVGLDRNARRLSTYFDTSYACAVHDATRTRVIWTLRRQSDIDGNPRTASWPDQGFWWDYERDAFGVFGTPTTVFSIGVIRPGAEQIAATPPVGTPQTLTTDEIGTTSARLSWVHTGGGDPTAQVIVEYKLASAGTYTVLQPYAPGTLEARLTLLTANTAYNWRLRYFKNGQYGSYTAVQSFTTAVDPSALPPTNVILSSNTLGGFEPETGLRTRTVTIAWTRGEYAAGSLTDVSESTTTDPAVGTITTQDAGNTSKSFSKIQTSGTFYYFVRHTLAGGANPSAWVAMGTNPVVY